MPPTTAFAATPRSEWIELGVVARAHGVHGWVRVRLADPTSQALSLLSEVSLGEPSRRMRVLAAVADPQGYRLRLEGIEDRDAAEALRGLPVLVARDQLPAPDDSEIYLSDLIGCLVVDPQGAMIGQVRSVTPGAAQPLLVVARAEPPGEEALIPWVAPIISDVDVTARRIVCDVPDGLLDLNRPAAERKDVP